MDEVKWTSIILNNQSQMAFSYVLLELDVVEDGELNKYTMS